MIQNYNQQTDSLPLGIEEIQDWDGLTPNQNGDHMLTKIKFQVKKSGNNEILYIVDGEIIRIDQYETSQIMTNLEQIYLLNWQGERSHSFQKIGKWTADWDLRYDGVGGFYKNV